MKEKILDTFRCAHQKILYKDLHIQRVIETFGFFHCLVDANKIIQFYDQIEGTVKADEKIRIEFTVESDFKAQVQKTSFQKSVEPILLIEALYSQQVSGIGLGNFKTTDRHYWEQNSKAIDAFVSGNNSDVTDVDVIGINDQGFVTETSRFNLFFYDGHKFFTPTLQSGCLKGVFREHCLQNDGVFFQGFRMPLVEKDFKISELNSFQIYVGNSVQGLLSAAVSHNELSY